MQVESEALAIARWVRMKGRIKEMLLALLVEVGFENEYLLFYLYLVLRKES